MARKKALPNWFYDQTKITRKFQVAKMSKHKGNNSNSQYNGRFRAAQKR